jgi:hypothetical protein
MKKFFVATVTLLTFGITGCETHHHDHARWEHRHDGDDYRWHNSGGYPEYQRGYQTPVPVYREYPDYRR